MSTSGTVTQNPAAKPGGSSSGAQGVRSPSAGTGSRLANCPRRMVTPVPATSASAVNSTIEARSRRPAGSSAAAIGGPIIAEATADVVCRRAPRAHLDSLPALGQAHGGAQPDHAGSDHDNVWPGCGVTDSSSRGGRAPSWMNVTWPFGIGGQRWPRARLALPSRAPLTGAIGCRCGVRRRCRLNGSRGGSVRRPLCSTEFARWVAEAKRDETRVSGASLKRSRCSRQEDP